MNTKILKNIVNQTSFAASTQESRPVLTGINFKINGNNLECTATDSYRLSRKIVEIDNNIDNDVNIIIPTKNLVELTKLFDDENEELEVHIFSNKIIFKFSTIIMMSRLINYDYPDTSKLIPSEFNINLIVNCHDFYSLLDRVSLLSSEEEKNTIKLESNGNNVIVSSNIPEIGNVEEKINVENDSNNDIKIAFSSKYMMDAIKSLDCETIKLSFNGEFKPIIIKNTDDDTLTQLILPIKTY